MLILAKNLEAMIVNDELVDRIAELARLEFEGEKKEAIKNDMNRMLNLIEKLNELDTTNVEPLKYMNEFTNVLREDKVEQTISQAEGLKNAPSKDSDFFKVPKVLNR